MTKWEQNADENPDECELIVGNDTYHIGKTDSDSEWLLNINDQEVAKFHAKTANDAKAYVVTTYGLSDIEG